MDDWRLERQRADQRFENLLREFREDCARREAERRKMCWDLRRVGVSIMRALNDRTRVLERIDRKLGAPGDWRSG